MATRGFPGQLPEFPQPKPGFDWTHVAWGKPDAPRSALCSYCSARIGKMPLMMWKPDGSAAQFCQACISKWWGR